MKSYPPRRDFRKATLMVIPWDPLWNLDSPEASFRCDRVSGIHCSLPPLPTRSTPPGRNITLIPGEIHPPEKRTNDNGKFQPWMKMMFISYWKITPPKFNSSPLKIDLPKRKVVVQPSSSRGELSNFGVLGGFSSLSCDAFQGEIFAHLHWHPSLVPLSIIWEERSQGISFVGWFTNVWNMNHGKQRVFFVSFCRELLRYPKYSLILFIFEGGGWKNAFKMSSKSTWCPGPFPFYHSLKFGLTLDPWCQSLPGFLFTSLGSGIPVRTFICHCY